MGSKVLGTAIVVVVAIAMLAVPASAGKGKIKLDKDSDRGRDVGFVLSGSATPTNFFLLKVKSKPRGVEVAAGGTISCNRGGSTAKNAQILKTKKAPFKIKIKPSLSRNKSCSMSVALNTDVQKKSVKVTGTLFHKK